MTRKKYIITIIILSTLAVLIIQFNGSDRNRALKTFDSIENFTAYLNESVLEIMNDYEVPGIAIAIIKDGEPIWINAYGYADIQRGRKIGVDVVFRVESISKSVTSWGILKLVEKGLIDLDAPVQKYLNTWKLPESQFSNNAITIRKLLSHNAGMPMGTIGVEYSPEEQIPSLRDYLLHEVRLECEPRTGFSYSNVGYNLLELIVEEVTGKDFSEYMKEEVLLPLGMKNSSFTWDDSLCSALPTGYDLRGNPVTAYVYPAKASGGLFATIEDVARFVCAEMTSNSNFNQKVLKMNYVSQLFIPRVKIPGIFGVVGDSYGYGHFVETLPNGRQAVWHGGQGHGWMSHFHIVPESGDGIVILTNSQRSWPVIAQILSDWAEWRGFGSIKMGKIIYGIFAMKIFICFSQLISVGYFLIILKGLKQGNRKFAPSSIFTSKSGIIKGVLGVFIISALVWSAAQPYLIVSSIFPGLSVWAGYSLLLFALILFASAFTKTLRRS